MKCPLKFDDCIGPECAIFISRGADPEVGNCALKVAGQGLKDTAYALAEIKKKVRA